MLPQWIKNQPPKFAVTAGALGKVSTDICKRSLQVDVWECRGARKGKIVRRDELFLKSSCDLTGVMDTVPAVPLGRGLQQSHSWSQPRLSAASIHGCSPGNLHGLGTFLGWR